MNQTMKAAYLVGPTTFDLRHTPIPALPEDGLLLQVKACGVCGSDLRRWKEGPQSGTLPVIAGHEIAGLVMAVGKQVQGFQTGDRLAVAPDVHCGQCFYCKRGLYNLCNHLNLIGITPGFDGGLAEVMLLREDMLQGGIVHIIPERLSYVEAALAEPLSSVLASHEEAGTTLGQTVVVLGGGPIGCLHIAVAQARGARAILSEPNETRRKLAERFNPEGIVDPLTQDLKAEVLRRTHDRGAELVICANGVAETHLQATEIVRKRGRVVLFGGLPRSNPMTTLNGNRIHYDEVTVTGAFSYHPRHHEMALEVIEHGGVRSEDVVTHTFNIDQVDLAFQTAASAAALKVMVQM